MLGGMICAAVLGLGLTGWTVSSTEASTVKTIQMGKSDAWQEFRFDIALNDGIWLDGEADPTAGPLDALSFGVSITEKSILQVTDAFRWGDVFELVANGVSLGRTSNPAAVATHKDYNNFGDFDAAVSENPEETRWSHAEFVLEPGEYDIQGYVVVMPEEKGRGALRLVDFRGTQSDSETAVGAPMPVPSPGSLPLLIPVVGLLLAVSKRRKIRSKGAHNVSRLRIFKMVFAGLFATALNAPAQANDAPQVCDRAYANERLKAGDYAAFCSCNTVSDQFLRTIQRATDFEAVLVETTSLCAPLASLLTDPITASLREPTGYADRSNGPSAGSASAPSDTRTAEETNTASTNPNPAASSEGTGTESETTGDTDATNQQDNEDDNETYNGW